MRWLCLLSTLFMAAESIAAGTTGPVISILSDGTLSIEGSANIPPYADGGRWQESIPMSSDRFVTRHFLFVSPGQPPAMEVYVTADRINEPPDGVFETSMIRAYLSSFSAGIGFSYNRPVFVEEVLASQHAKLCRVELSNGDRRIWLNAYIFLCRPSLVFLTVRPQADPSRDFEEFLAKVRFK